MKMAKPTSRTAPSQRPMAVSMPSTISSAEAATENGISFFTVDGLMTIGATTAAHPTMSMAFMMFEPTTFPTAISGVPFRADIRLTKNSGIEVPQATMVRPITISGTPNRRAMALAPSVRRSAPTSTNVTPIIINNILRNTLLFTIYGLSILLIMSKGTGLRLEGKWPLTFDLRPSAFDL